MKHFFLIILFFCLVAEDHLGSIKAQTLDFDSLMLHDDAFNKKMISDFKEMDIFDDDKIMRLSIASDFKNLIKRKYKGEYQPALLKYHVNDTVVATRNIEIKPRGNMRRQVCHYPPLKLNFPKKTAFLNQIHDFDKLKMVVNCKRSSQTMQYLLSEYFAYKIYNLITDYSFRVRLVEISYIDTGGKFRPGTGYSYFIENIEQLADRLDAIPSELKNIKDTYTDQGNLANIYLFQFLIGNTDWSIPARHNIAMINPIDPQIQKPYPIPYDFDYSGIVNANYAVPDENLGIESVTVRVYRGVCIEEQYITATIQRFIKTKEEIYQLYDSPLLDKRNANSSLKYLEEFYQIIENDRSAERYILGSCR